MAHVCIIGATGYTGRLVVAACRRRGLSVVAAGRDAGKLRALGGESVVVDLARPETLAAAIDPARVVISCAGPFLRLGEPVVARCAERGVHYLDTTGEQPFVQHVFERFQQAACALVPACAFEVAVGDGAATLAARGLEPLDSVDIGYELERFGTSRGTRKSVVGMAGRTGVVYEDGAWQPLKMFSETRRFDGRAAALFPSPEIITVPHHVKTRACRTFLVANPVVRTVGPLAAAITGRMRGLLDRGLDVTAEGPSESAREKARFTIHAEARGPAGTRDVRVRGRDIYGVTAEIAALGAARMLDPGFGGRGPLAPSQLLPPDDLFRDLEAFGVSVDT